MFKYQIDDDLMPPPFTIEVHETAKGAFEAFSKNDPDLAPTLAPTQAQAYAAHLNKLHQRVRDAKK